MEGSAFVEVMLPLALAIVMVGIGLTLTVDDFKEQSQSKLALGLGVLGQCIIAPILAFAVAQVLNVSPATAVGLVLVAATPGGATSNLMSFLGRGNVALGIVLTVLTSFVSIVTLPVLVGLALDVWGGDIEGPKVTVPFGEVLSLLLFIIFVPILIGLTIKRRLPELAARLERMVSVFSIFILLFLIIGILVDLGSDAIPMLKEAGPASLLISSASVAVAFGLGALGRLPRKDIIGMAAEFGIKNITLGILIGLTVLESEAMAAPSAIYAVIMYIPSVVVVAIGRRWFPEPAGSVTARA